MQRDDWYTLCKKYAPQYGYDPIMVLAQIEQESSYDENEPRLEQGYYLKYVRTDPKLKGITPPVKSLMSSSFGAGQLLGHSLFQLDYFFALDSVSVAMKLDEYVGSPEQQVATLCQWLKKKQGMGDSHTLDDALRRYNGSAEYPPLVYARFKKLRAIYDPNFASE